MPKRHFPVKPDSDFAVGPLRKYVDRSIDHYWRVMQKHRVLVSQKWADSEGQFHEKMEAESAAVALRFALRARRAAIREARTPRCGICQERITDGAAYRISDTRPVQFAHIRCFPAKTREVPDESL